MKTLYESLLDDFDILNSKADEGMSKYKKLAGCLDGHVSNGMKFSLGPSYYSISEYSKYLKSQFKNNYTEIKD